LSFFTFAFLAGCSAKSKGSGRIGYLLWPVGDTTDILSAT
jgi:hypothetical protein